MCVKVRFRFIFHTATHKRGWWSSRTKVL